jgi:nicotinate-nucleotide pyrophosphorylase (carboxylating)
MDRKEMLNLAFGRNKELTLSNAEYLKWVKRYTTEVLEQDLGKKGDITTLSIFGKERKPAKAVVRAKEDGVVAGIEEVTWFYKQRGIGVKPHKKDGEPVKSGSIILELNGPRRDLLETERTGLKILQRMSGIATATKRVIDKIREAGSDTMIVATRKTHWQYLDKKAVSLGGGLTHRLGLWESILIKDNHLRELKKLGYVDNYVEEALERSWRYIDEAMFIEIEVENGVDAIKAAEKFRELQQKLGRKPSIIMLDNMSPEKIREVIRELKKRGLYDHVLLEASGEINQGNILEYAKTGIDAISLGSLTHSAKALNMDQSII